MYIDQNYERIEREHFNLFYSTQNVEKLSLALEQALQNITDK